MPCPHRRPSSGREHNLFNQHTHMCVRACACVRVPAWVCVHSFDMVHTSTSNLIPSGTISQAYRTRSEWLISSVNRSSIGKRSGIGQFKPSAQGVMVCVAA